MPTTVLLKDIVDVLEMQFDESPSFVDLDTGQVKTVSSALLSQAEEFGDEEPDLSDWQKDEWETAKRIASTDRFARLPSEFDVHEWEIMQDFAHSISSERVRTDLLNALHGAGAFRYFKDTLQRHRIEPAWFDFREQALRQIAIDWCDENQIAWH